MCRYSLAHCLLIQSSANSATQNHNAEQSFDQGLGCETKYNLVSIILLITNCDYMVNCMEIANLTARILCIIRKLVDRAE